MAAVESSNSAAMRQITSSSLLPPFRAAASAACWLVIATAAIAFGFFYSTTPTRWYQVRATELITWRNTLILQYNFANATTGRITPLLSGSLCFMLIWQWCGTLAVALGSAGLLWLSAADATSTFSIAAEQKKRPGCGRWSLGSAIRRAVTRARRLFSYRLPPGRLWRAVLGPGGLSLLDLLLILLWFGLHVLWMHEMTMRVLDNRRAEPPPPKSGSPPPSGAKASAPSSITSAGSAPKPPANAPAPSPSSSSTSGTAVSPSPAAASKARPETAVRRLLQVSPAPSGSAGGKSSSSQAAGGSQAPPSAKAAATPPPARKLKPLPEVVKDSVAKYFGWVGRLDILLLFFPLARCNFLSWLLGSDFPALIKYHRWLGHGTLVIYSLHGISYMLIWTHDGVLRTMLDWGMGAGVNRMSGLVALCGGWLLWLTSLPFIRRRLFNLFYACHILGAMVFMLFAFMHRKDVATWVMPGVFLYLLDVVLRTIQQNFNSVRLSAIPGHPSCAAVARVAPGGGVLSLSIRCHQSLRWCGSEVVFLRVPQVSWWQWHPFTTASASTSCPGADNRMELHIKKYNRWTQRLIARLSTDSQPVTLYVSGPYGHGIRNWITAADTHVFVTGGIGVTPALGMIQELIAFRRRWASDASADATISADGTKAAADTASSLASGRVLLIWISRTLDELQALPYEIMQEARASKASGTPWLDLRLFLTAKAGPTTAATAATAADCHAADSTKAISVTALRSTGAGCSSSDSSRSNAREEGAVAAGEVVAGVAGAAEACSTVARSLSHPYMFSPLLWMAAAVLSFGGGFAGLMCAQAYDAHMARTVAVRKDFSYIGLLQFATLGLGTMLPPALLMLAVHLFRRFSRCSSSFPSPYSFTTLSSGAAAAVVSIVDAAATGQKPGPAPAPAPNDAKSALMSPSSYSLESYITSGRPDLLDLLGQISRAGFLNSSESESVPTQALASDFDSCSYSSAAAAVPLEDLRVAVYAAGPEPLVASVCDTCNRINGLCGRRGQAYMAFRATTYEL